ncbi:DUF2267 domain-containing protein [Nostoc sp. NIES-2111]
MTSTHVPVLDSTIGQTNRWLALLASDLHTADRHLAYSALRAVLHALRDQLTPEQSAHLSAQLPMLVRGIFFEGWQPARTPAGDRTVADFAQRVAKEFPPNYPRAPTDAAQAVLRLLFAEIDPGETAKIVHSMPDDLRSLWPAAAQ